MGGVCGTHGDKRNAHRILAGKPERRDYLQDADGDGSIILKWLLKQDRIHVA
jgi:hypothetical protein